MHAGRMLAAKIVPKYKDQDCAILALNDGGVMVGAQIARELNCVLMLLLTDEITLPREPEALAGVTSGGDFAYNSTLSSGEIDEYVSEFHNFIEQEKLRTVHELNRMVKKGSVVEKRLLRNKNIILVADGLSNPFDLDLALAYLKTVIVQHLVFAIPLASVKVVDKMHVTGNDIYCLSVVEDYIDTDHYYDKHDIPPHEEIIAMLKKLIADWTANNA
jgi:predicted phosphoribosyltransferase